METIIAVQPKPTLAISSAKQCMNVYKAFQEINNVMFKCSSIEVAYFQAWSTLIKTQYYLTLPSTYIIEANRIINDNIINVHGELNTELINSIVMDEL